MITLRNGRCDLSVRRPVRPTGRSRSPWTRALPERGWAIHREGPLCGMPMPVTAIRPNRERTDQLSPKPRRNKASYRGSCANGAPTEPQRLPGTPKSPLSVNSLITRVPRRTIRLSISTRRADHVVRRGMGRAEGLRRDKAELGRWKRRFQAGEGIGRPGRGHSACRLRRPRGLDRPYITVSLSAPQQAKKKALADRDTAIRNRATVVREAATNLAERYGCAA